MNTLLPAGSNRVETAQVPEATVHVPRNIVAVLKVTVPVATDGEMEAVNVTRLPKVAGEPGLALRTIETDPGPVEVGVEFEDDDVG